MMPNLRFNKRLLALGIGLVHLAGFGAFPAAGQSDEIGVLAYPFHLSQITLGEGRWSESQDRTLNYLLWIDPDRLLYNFRANHGLSTGGAASNSGWDEPTFPFRSHAQGHFLTAWAQCWAVLKNEECRDRAAYFVAELQKCQANNEAVGFNPGYLSGFPESEIARVENRTLNNGNVPYYSLHKTLAGLLDVWRYVGDDAAGEVLLAFTEWVDWRTARLSYAAMQAMLRTEYGGMNEVLADVFHFTGDARWLEVAQRFDDALVFDPLAANQDRLDGLHANTQVPKWIGAAREFKATGTARYLDIARNAWDMTVNAHTYAIGGNSRAEHFRPADAIAGHLTADTCESCNTYNMLKLTRELWLVDPSDTSYFDYYERALINHLIGIQNPESSHGHITYFTPLNPGGRKGVSPAWGGGTWSTDYDSFWCCQVTALETFTKLADSVYFYDNSTLYINQFTPSRLDWSQRGVVVTQTTGFPDEGNSTVTIQGSGSFSVAIRIPSWATGASIAINGEPSGVDAAPGAYAVVEGEWADGDEIAVSLPFSLYTIAANDDPDLAAVAYGPLVLSGHYGTTSPAGNPTIDLGTIVRQGSRGAEFQATVDGQSRRLFPFYDAHDTNYVVYWQITGSLPERHCPGRSGKRLE
ncbi:hypothetical protein S40293_04808 [Stachybotrys chartarum IBT 40293]|nr:hypothetical protein S40293_04808 [Stachybotrys chartarum IBT 40293]